MKILSFRAWLSYQFRLLRLFNFRRIINYIGLQGSYQLSYFFRIRKPWGVPFAISIEPTTACNLRCPECPSGLGTLSRATGKISLEDFRKILEKLPSETSWLTFYFQGEPFLNRDFFEMVKLAKQRRMFVSTSTNGHFLDQTNVQKTIDSGLDKIIISLDGADAATYLQYRKGGDFEKVVAGIKTLTGLKKTMKSSSPLVVIQFLVFKQNEHQINEIAALSKSLGADVLEFKTAQHYDFEEGSPYMTGIDKYSRYRKTAGGKYELKHKLKNRCQRMWVSCVITWDGNVAPCCYDKNAVHSYGNILHNDFMSIWNGKESECFRHSLRQNRKGIEICRNCHE